MNWYIGQKVVCVDPLQGSGLMLGATYVVTGVDTECKCGILLRVGISLPTIAINGVPNVVGEPTRCVSCGHRYILRSMDRPFFCHRFRPIDALTETMERIEKEGAPIEQPQPEMA